MCSWSRLTTLAVVVLLNAPLLGAQASKPARVRRWQEELLKRFDKDGDGKLSQQERQAARRQMLERRGEPPAPTSAPAIAGVRPIRNVEYARVGNKSLLLDMYLPEREKGPVPVVVWVHGGAWQAGSRIVCPAIILAAHGYAVVSIDYRLTGEAVFPAQIHDCKGAIRWVRAHAREYGFDPDRIGAWGSSAGGHLVALLGTSSGVKELEGDVGGNLKYSSRVQAVCDFCGPSSFRKEDFEDDPASAGKAASGVVAKLLGGPIANNREKAALASPVSHISRDDPPFLIAHGGQDKVVPVDHSRVLAVALKEAGVEVTLHIVPGAGHGVTSLESLKMASEFFDKHLKNRAEKLNVLFIAVDDLRPELACYGASYVRSPNIDKLAAGGVLFSRAYCQQAVCSPSRTSLLTGLRPDSTRIYDLNTHFRKTIPDAVTLPEYFKKHGYHTQGLSKIFHGGLDDPQSWSVPHWAPQADTYHNPESRAALKELRQKADKEGSENRKDKIIEKDPKTGLVLRVNRVPQIKGPSWEASKASDSDLADGKTADKAIEVLREIKDRPFFLAVGFLKPHLPFIAPKKYFDLYSPDQIRLAGNPNPPEDVPSAAMHDSGELRSYSDIPKKGPIPNDKARDLIRAYRAATSFTDAQIGRVLDELERLGLSERTIVVLWGDHGWQLGEHGLWCKHTNFETSTRSMLILRAPGRGPSKGKSDALVEFVDIYPTLCELAGLPAPEGLQGVSFAPLVNKPDRPWKKAAFSQYPRNRLMGYSIRTDRYRYTEWGEPDKEPVGVELYDHRADPGENVNIAGKPEYKSTVEEMRRALHAGWREALPQGKPGS